MGPKRKKTKRIKEEQSDVGGHRYSTRQKSHTPKPLSKSPTTPLKKPVSSNQVTEPQKYFKLSFKPPLITAPVNSQPSSKKSLTEGATSTQPDKYLKLSFKRKLNTSHSDSQPSTSKSLKEGSSSTSKTLKTYVKQVDRSQNVTPPPKGPPGSPIRTPPLRKPSGKGGPFKGKSGKGGTFKSKSGKGGPFKKSKLSTSGESADGVYDPFATLRADISNLNEVSPPSSPTTPTQSNRANIDVNKEHPALDVNRRDPQSLSDPTKPSTSTPIQNVEEPPPDADRVYKLYEFKRHNVQKYGVAQINYRVKFCKEWEGQTLHSLQASLYQMFEDLLDELSNEHHAQDKVRIFIHSSDSDHSVFFMNSMWKV
jgi:hypothetical protein